MFENLRKLALYTGVSLGALALSGCSVKEEYDPYATDVLKQDYAEMVSYPVTIYASNYEELEEKDHLFFGDDFASSRNNISLAEEEIDGSELIK